MRGRNNKNTPTLREDRYATGSCPPGRRCEDSTKNKHKTKKIKQREKRTQIITKNRLSTHHINTNKTSFTSAREATKQTKTTNSKITFEAAAAVTCGTRIIAA